MTATLPAPRRLLAGARPAYDAVLGDNVKGGRFTTAGLSPVVRQLTIVGLVVLFALLGSLLLGDVWRQDELLAIDALDGPIFLPAALFPVTVLALYLGWLLITVGASLSGARVQVGAALLFLVCNGTLGEPLVITLSDDTAIRYGPTAVKIAYFTAPALLLLHALSATHPTSRRRLQPLVTAGVALACLTMAAGLLWMQSAAVELGQPTDLPDLVSGAILQITNLVLPLVFLSQLALIEFSWSVSTATVATVPPVGLQVVRVLFLGLVVGKLCWQVLSDVDGWGAYVDYRQLSILRTTASLAVLALAVWALRRWLRPRGDEPAEGLLHGSALLIALPLFIIDIALTLAAAVTLHVGVGAGRRVLDGFPSAPVSDHGDLVVAVVVLVAALAALWAFERRRRRDPGRPTDTRVVLAGAALIAGWAVSAHLLQLLTVDPGVRYALVDLAVTAGVLVFALARWPRLDAPRLGGLAVLVLFTWLVASRGDVFTLAAGWLSLPAIFIVVLGIVLTLLTDSGFSRRGTQRLPRSARALMWIGYLVLNVALLNWVQVTRSFDIAAAAADRAVFYVGIPLAVWLLAVRQPTGRSATAEPAVLP